MSPQSTSEFRSLLKLAAPIAIAHLANMSMQVVDTMFVGRLGPEAIGGVSVGNALFVCFMILGLGLLLGMDFLVSHAFGARKIDDCHRHLVQALYVAVLTAAPFVAILYFASDVFPAMGITPGVADQAGRYLRVLSFSLLPFLLFTAFRQYLQAMGVAAPITVILIAANVVNALGNWLFVFGALGFPKLGIAGSGLATLISRIFMLTCVVAFVLWRNQALRLGMERVTRRFSPRGAFEIARLGLPAGLQLLLEVGAFATATLLAGRLGAKPLAAHQVVLQVASITFMVPLGLASAAAVRVGQALGSGQPLRAIRLGWLSIALAGAIMAVFGLILYLLSAPIMRAFTSDEAVVAIGGGLLLIAAVFQVADGVQVVAAGILRGTGNTRAAMVSNFVGHWLLGIPVLVGLGFGAGWGVRGIWLGLSVGLISVAVMLAWVWLRRTRLLRTGEITSPGKLVEHGALE